LATPPILSPKRYSYWRKKKAILSLSAQWENFASVAPAFDGFLVAPHIQYKVAEIRGIVGDARSIAVIESLPYASLDAEKVFAFVMAQMPELAV